MNRPEAKNALSSEMLARMYDAWVELTEDDDLRAGSSPAPAARSAPGMDLKAFAGGPARRRSGPSGSHEDDDLHWKALLRHYRPTKPLIAAVEGFALAGGTEILQATDIRVAGEGAVVRHHRGRPGPVPPRRLDRAAAPPDPLHHRRRAAPHRPAGARPAEAKEIGLIGHVVPDGTALDKAMEIAEVIAENAPLSVKAVLASLREGAEMTEADALANELTHGWPIFATEDAKEGATAFKEKRKAQFKGR